MKVRDVMTHKVAFQKGPDILLEAIPPLLGFHPHARFVFAGDGDMRWGLEERARQLGVSQAVRFLGFKSGLELVELYKSCDLVCMPSRNEPFGIVLLEAWAPSPSHSQRRVRVMPVLVPAMS